MRYPIKEHKGQTIYYDDNYDKFVCDIELNDNLKSTKRNKIEDVEKEIDSFIKANYKFIPFTAFVKEYSTNLVKIVSIRTDGVLVCENRNQYKPSEFDKFYSADYDTIKELEVNESTFKTAKNNYDTRKKELHDRLVKMDMSSYILNPIIKQ